MCSPAARPGASPTRSSSVASCWSRCPLIPILIWLIIVLSTGLGAIDDTIDRLPKAYGWGGTGLLILAAGLAIGYRELKPDVSNPVVQGPPVKAPWE